MHYFHLNAPSSLPLRYVEHFYAQEELQAWLDTFCVSGRVELLCSENLQVARITFPQGCCFVLQFLCVVLYMKKKMTAREQRKIYVILCPAVSGNKWAPKW